MEHFKKFCSYYMPYKKWMILDLFCAICSALINISFPVITDYAINTCLPEKNVKIFLVLMLSSIAAYFINGFLIYTVSYVGHNTGVQIQADIREDLFAHMQKLSFSFYDKNRVGNLMSRITTDLYEITELAHHGPEDALICSFTLLGAMAAMFILNWRLAVSLAFLIPLTAIYIGWREKVTISIVEDMQEKMGGVNSELETSLTGIRVTKAFCNEDFEKERFRRSNEKFRSAKKNYFKQLGIYMMGMDWIKSAMRLSIIFIGGLLYLKGQATFANLVSFNLFVMVLMTPIQKMIDFSEILIGGISGFRRFSKMMEEKPDINEQRQPVELEHPKGKITFHEVNFSYESSREILKEITFDIPSGTSMAFVGNSGAGKTTLCHLIPRFYDVTGGRVEIDDIDIRNISLKSLRENIGMVQQDVFIFPDTIMENIRYGRLSASDEEVIEAAKMAEIHDDIMDMKAGYQTYVGERGAMLSGGQKQRLSIARMFLKNPPIVLLDEATSALDSVTEMKIQEALDRLSKNKTMVLIAHRLSTIRNADTIAVIDQGRIVEMGSHEELMELEGQYSHYYKAQYHKEKEKEHGKNK